MFDQTKIVEIKQQQKIAHLLTKDSCFIQKKRMQLDSYNF